VITAATIAKGEQVTEDRAQIVVNLTDSVKGNYQDRFDVPEGIAPADILKWVGAQIDARNAERQREASLKSLAPGTSIPLAAAAVEPSADDIARSAYTARVRLLKDLRSQQAAGITAAGAIADSLATELDKDFRAEWFTA
jgi:hypothetical protein